MKKALLTLACMAAMGLTSVAHAAVLTFDTPGLIDIDNNTGVATYQEGSFTLAGQAATYLPLDFVGTGGSGGLLLFAGNLLTLSAAGGGLFSLLGLDFGLFDPNDSGSLDLHGLLADSSALDQTLPLGALQNFSFQGWSGLREVTFNASANIVLDNINAVPEPGSAALTLTALSGLLLVRRRHPAKRA